MSRGTTMLRKRLLARITAARVELLKQPPGEWVATKFLDRFTDEALADEITSRVTRFVSYIADETIRAAVVEHDELALRWPLNAGRSDAARAEGLADDSDFMHIVLESMQFMFAREHAPSITWPIEVSAAEVARALDRLNDPEASIVAAHVRANGVAYEAPSNAPDRPRVALVSAARALSAINKWTPIALAVVVDIERKVSAKTALSAARLARVRMCALYKGEINGIAISVLNEEKDDDGRRSEAKTELATALLDAIEKLAKVLDVQSLDADPRSEEEATSLVRQWDERYCEYLLRLDAKDGADAVKAVRTKIARRSDEGLSGAALWEPWERARIVMMARCLWPRVRSRLARSDRNVRVPSDLASTMADARGQRCFGGQVRPPFEPLRIIVQPPKGVALLLPLYDSIKTSRGGIALARVLKPAVFKFWLGSLIVYEDQGMREDGSFDCEDVDPILDVIGTKSSNRKAHHTSNRRDAREHAKILSESRVVQVGSICQEGGDAVLSRLHLDTGDKTIGYAHSRLVVAALRGARNANGVYEKPEYLQVPRELVRIDAHQIFPAMGLATVIRSKMFAMLKAKTETIEVPLTAVLDAAGERWRDEAAKRGAQQYFAAEAETLGAIADKAGLGSVRSDGRGRDTILTITVSEKVREGYRTPSDGARGLVEGAIEQGKAKRRAGTVRRKG